MTWSPQQYLQFEDDRTRPVRDLVAAIPTAGVRHATDLGCGPGNSTEVLAARYPDAAIAGIDTSSAMVEAARQRMPGAAFSVGDAAHWSASEPQDVILSNAALHWVPDHATLFPGLATMLAPGGTLAVQMPENEAEPAYEAMREVAARPEFAGKLRQAGGFRAAMASAREYYGMLRPVCRRVDVFRTTYHHVLPGGVDDVVEWFRGSGLRPYLAPLDEAGQGDFLSAYRSLIETAYPALPDGSVLLPFPRLFIVATR